MQRVAFVFLLVAAACKGAPPAGTPGPDADALAREMQKAVDTAAWAETGAVRWTFTGKNAHVWDRKRGFAMVTWDDGERVGLIDIDDRVGVAFGDGAPLAGDDAKKRLDETHAKWTNDAFWLNPIAKVFDEGTVRELVPERDGRRGLLVRYESGGRTPGDAYLWWLSPSGRPEAWQMWTSNIPVGGVEASWTGWVELPTGAWISTKHALPVFDLELSAVDGGGGIEALFGAEDPFAPLVACLEQDTCTAF